MEAAVADLLPSSRMPLDVRAVAEVEADQMAQQMRVGLGQVAAVVGSNSGAMPRSSFAWAASMLSLVGDLQRQAKMSRSRP